MPDVAASVKARLLNGARVRGEEFERTLARFAAERLLYRLGASAVSDRCVLKGAGLLVVWLPDPYRVTRDVDLLAFGSADDDAIRTMLTEVCEVSCHEDGLRFDLSDLQIEEIRPDEKYAGKRARFTAHLGKARISVQVDFGFGDAVGAEIEHIEYPTILPGLPVPRLRAYPREASVAEKFQAMVSLDTRNSRMKDFHDIWALSGAFAFDGQKLQQAVDACFERRGTPWRTEVPRALTSTFYQSPEIEARWRSYLAGGAIVVPPPAQFEVIGESITSFLAPVRNSLVEDAQFTSTWKPGGPWR